MIKAPQSESALSDADMLRYRAWLRASIAEIGITQAELGRRVGLERDQVNRLLTGKRRIDPQTIEGIARVLRLPPPDIGAAA